MTEYEFISGHQPPHVYCPSSNELLAEELSHTLWPKTSQWVCFIFKRTQNQCWCPRLSPGQSGRPEFAINDGLQAARRSKHSRPQCFFIFLRIMKQLEQRDPTVCLGIFSGSYSSSKSVEQIKNSICVCSLLTLCLYGCSEIRGNCLTHFPQIYWTSTGLQFFLQGECNCRGFLEVEEWTRLLSWFMIIRLIAFELWFW